MTRVSDGGDTAAAEIRPAVPAVPDKAAGFAESALLFSVKQA